LRKIRPWWGHHYHFHVRMNCPAGSPNCQEQDPIPRGDGCESAIWWVTDALDPPAPDPNAPPPPKKVPRGPLTLADLPRQCSAVLR
ncbi:MAG: penicillin-insensitive murein endopeptidase, partial [Pseudomonadota bacterium]